MVVLKTGTLVGACYEVVANPPLSVFEEQLGVLFQCQDDYQGSRRDPQVKGKTPTDVVERKRSLAVVKDSRKPRDGAALPFPACPRGPVENFGP